MEHLEKRFSDFKKLSHLQFKCLSQDITPTSIKLKTNIKTHKAINIICKVERWLLQGCIRTINKTTDPCALEKEKWKQHSVGI